MGRAARGSSWRTGVWFYFARVGKVHARYYTDPACPWSWALEPALKRLAVDFGDSVRITYVMGGLAREFDAVELVVGEWLNAADRSGMPVDPRVWLEGGLASSFPACLAVKAAAEQGDPGAYLRRLREGILCGRRKLDTTEALVEEARATGGIDIDRFRIDLRSNAIVELFGADLERAAAVPEEHHASGSRARLPTLEFAEADGGEPHFVSGLQPYEALRDAAAAAGADRTGAGPAPAIEEVLARLGPLATAEVAAICDLPGPRAAAELWRLAVEWRVRGERRLTGYLWSAASGG
jgi:predicted DsbA family dithiol-disulfide isomerase